MLKRTRFGLSVATVLILVPWAAAQTYTITELGAFPGGTVSEGYGVNRAGQLAGYARTANYDAYGFIWSARAGLRQVSSIPPQSNFGVAQAINSSLEAARKSYELWTRTYPHELQP